MKPKVIISTLPIRNRGYFEWLYTGLQILHEKGEIELTHEGCSWDLFLRKHPRVYGRINQHFPDLAKMMFPVDHFSMFGRVESGGKSTRFAYDVTDSPFTYALAHLELVDTYFKTQCPVTIEAEGYPLSETIRVPYHPFVVAQKHKIVPAMSTGPITSTFNLKRNLALLASYASIPVKTKRIRIFASFGGDRGPAPWKIEDEAPAPHNAHNERSIVSIYGERIQHPNVKRAEIVRLLRSWNKPDIDARIWNSKDASIQGDALEWSEYLKTVSESVFNVNVSGFRRSLPFRFLDSFQVGCGIATDTLGTKWYRQFDKEIECVEYGDLGYEAKENVDLAQIESKLKVIYQSADLRKNHASEIRNMFSMKWHPQALASYFVSTCMEKV